MFADDYRLLTSPVHLKVVSRATAQAARRRDFARTAPSTSDWPTLLAVWEALLLDLGVERYRVFFSDGEKRTVLASTYPFDADEIAEVTAVTFRFPTPLGPELCVTFGGLPVTSPDAQAMLGGPAAVFAIRLLQLPEFRTSYVADAPQRPDFHGLGNTCISFRSA